MKKYALVIGLLAGLTSLCAENVSNLSDKDLRQKYERLVEEYVANDFDRMSYVYHNLKGKFDSLPRDVQENVRQKAYMKRTGRCTDIGDKLQVISQEMLRRELPDAVNEDNGVGPWHSIDRVTRDSILADLYRKKTALNEKSYYDLVTLHNKLDQNQKRVCSHVDKEGRNHTFPQCEWYCNAGLQAINEEIERRSNQQ